ncbi:uncharacterized protein LOC120302492 isoform X3 [Crotalus tigris]|uniref:uncharacterized protein LOC120302492 isoform X3 n=1 Tax=Crotalus tigris TaxID=88082 RepID=UPI00192F9518|nr:uncharacterized protein LOC120302492 isoform X3 [Crotalus tigris]XP_039186928.1 uncharacterized protein LOC120302492 isoform X3 [Crotalus tigris]
MEARGSQESGTGAQGSFGMQLPAVEWEIPWKGGPGRPALGSRRWEGLDTVPGSFAGFLLGPSPKDWRGAGSAERCRRSGRAVPERRGYVAPKAASTKGACGAPPASLGLPLASRHRQSFGRGSADTWMATSASFPLGKVATGQNSARGGAQLSPQGGRARFAPGDPEPQRDGRHCCRRVQSRGGDRQPRGPRAWATAEARAERAPPRPGDEDLSRERLLCPSPAAARLPPLSEESRCKAHQISLFLQRPLPFLLVHAPDLLISSWILANTSSSFGRRLQLLLDTSWINEMQSQIVTDGEI